MPLPILAVLGLVAQYAPQLIRRLAGDKAGAVADKVASVAQAVTGTTSPEEAVAKANADPALAAQLRVRPAEIELDEERLEQQDREDARQRDIEVRKLTGGRNQRADWMVGTVAFGLIVCVLILGLYHEKIPEGVITLLTTIASIFGICLRDAFTVEFGSSRGSKDKDAALVAAAQKE